MVMAWKFLSSTFQMPSMTFMVAAVIAMESAFSLKRPVGCVSTLKKRIIAILTCLLTMLIDVLTHHVVA